MRFLIELKLWKNTPVLKQGALEVLWLLCFSVVHVQQLCGVQTVKMATVIFLSFSPSLF